MTKPLASIRTDVLDRTVALMDATFSTRDVSEHPDMQAAHPDLVSHRNYHAFVGVALSARRVVLRLEEVRKRTSRGSHWRKPEGSQRTEVSGAAGGPYLPVLSGRGWSEREQARQVRWKEEVAGVVERGEHNGRSVPYLFPRERWSANLLPAFRQDVLDHLAGLDIELHEFAHHVRSSQAFALNLAAPFVRHPHLLRPILAALLPADIATEIAAVDRVEAEVVDPDNRFGEGGKRGAQRTSADLGIWYTSRTGWRGLLLVEVKYTEDGFGGCTLGARLGGSCDTDGARVVDECGTSCPLTGSTYRRTYWRLAAELGVFRTSILRESTACPFRHDGYQLMRNQLLAAVLERDPGLDRADFAVLLHDDNPTIRTLASPLGGSTSLELGWKATLSDPGRFHLLSARRWLEAGLKIPDLHAWSTPLLARYFGVDGPSSPAVPQRPLAGAVRPGHWMAVEYLGSQGFQQVRKLYEEVCGAGGVYFRPVDGQVNVIALHPLAPAYLGHQDGSGAPGYVLKAGHEPTRAELLARHAAFERWLPTVTRGSAEERAVIGWLRSRLARGLRLDELGEGWALLHQEWRFRGRDGRGRKSDVLAVHIPTGRLGIVEAKSRYDQRHDAVAQLLEYRELWLRDEADLAPFFSAVLQAQGRLYGDAAAVSGQVLCGEPALFFLWPTTTGSVGIEAVSAR